MIQHNERKSSFSTWKTSKNKYHSIQTVINEVIVTEKKQLQPREIERSFAQFERFDLLEFQHTRTEKWVLSRESSFSSVKDSIKTLMEQIKTVVRKKVDFEKPDKSL